MASSFMQHQDVVSLYNLLWKPYSSFMKSEHEDDWKWCMDNVKSARSLHKLGDLPHGDCRRAYAMNPKFVSALINNEDLAQLNSLMPLVDGAMMIRRSAQSSIPDRIDGGLVSLRGLLPEVHAQTITIHQDPYGAPVSQAIHFNLSVEYNEAIRYVHLDHEPSNTDNHIDN